MCIMNKKGMSNHVEMILASVMFLMFFFFVITFLQPYKTDILTTSIVDGIFYNLESNVSIDVRQIMLYVSDNQELECFSVQLGDYFDYGSIVVCSDGDVVDSTINNGQLSIYSNENIFYVLFSKDFHKKNSDLCQISNEHDVGGIYDFNVFYEDKLTLLRNDYFSNYDLLKNTLGVPNQFDFSIDSESFSLTRDIPDGIEVIAKEYVENIIDDSGKIKNEVFLIKVR